uniref:Uncharacterized protein n=1 Tax=Rhipicephalus zambeziensis TaxID=60191 RepID=A0A224YFJ9_9ACAR
MHGYSCKKKYIYGSFALVVPSLMQNAAEWPSFFLIIFFFFPSFLFLAVFIFVFFFFSALSLPRYFYLPLFAIFHSISLFLSIYVSFFLSCRFAAISWAN